MSTWPTLRIILGTLCLLAAVPGYLAGQQRRVEFPKHPISDECGSDGCEEAAMMVAAILAMLEWDTDLAHFAGSPVVARVLATVHADPSGPACLSRLSGQSPALAVLDKQVTSFADRRGKPISLVSCAQVSAPSGEHPLTNGPPLVVLSPIDWTGPDDARVRLAVFLAPGWHGADFYIYLHRGSTGWAVTRIGPGAAR